MIPVLRPKLPTAKRLAPYLAEIDRSRLYSNFGPHAQALEEHLAAHFGLSAGTVTTVANATLGLTLALMAQGAPAGTLCVLPAWTFVASAHAVVLAGLVPYFVDVDRSTWTIDAAAVEAEIARAPGRVGAVMVVAPFGRPIDVTEWDAFHSRTGVPVVIDAAAGFDGLRPGVVPSVVSLHATKVFGVGEGGFVVSADPLLIAAVRTRSNFGFSGSRDAVATAVNAKLSEYHAAIGLAALAEWKSVRSEWMAVARAYRESMQQSNRVRFQDGFGETWIASTCVISLTDGGSARAETILAKAGVETRRWWGNGAHVHPATVTYPRTSLPVTERLVDCTIGLPFFRELGADEIRRIGQLVHTAESRFPE